MVWSPDFWKHTPSTFGGIFGIELPYRPPRNSVGAFVWRWRFWLETTIGLSLLEPWEKILMIVFVYLMLALTMTGFLKYLPERTAFVQERMTYYLFGQEAPARGSVQRLVAGLVGHGHGLAKEL
ncbi:hypothetical protein EIP86_006624 [Pleurotus ostreatoroseus]|nr:hypothetical protein EIP86_006624 [Pleurotus ostreatoroseus]